MRAGAVIGIVGLVAFAVACAGAGASDTTATPAPEAEPRAAGREAKAGKRPPRERSAEESLGEASARAALFPRMSLNNTPLVVRAADGTRHAAWIESRGVVAARWEGDEKVETLISPAAGQIATIASDGAKGLALVHSDPSRRLYLSTSADGGRSWGEAVEVPSAGGRHTSPTLRAWSEGGELRALVAWTEGERKVSSAVYSAAWDGDWSDVQRVDSSTAMAEFPSLTGRGSSSTIAWRDDRSGSHEVYVARLPKPGGKWKQEEATGFSGRDPSVCVDGEGRLYLAWHDRLKLSFSRWDGRAWSPAEVVGQGLFARVDCDDDGAVLISYERYTEPGRMQEDDKKTFGLALSRDRGETFEALDPAEGKVNVIYASASLGPDGTVDAIWLDKAAAEIRTWTRAPDRATAR